MENLFEKIMENFPNLAKETDFQEVQEAQRVPKKLDPRKHTPRHIKITLPKIKDKEVIIKATREKETVTYKGVPIRLCADFSKETLQARCWKEVLKVMKGKDLHPRLFYPAKLSFRMEGNSIFSYKLVLYFPANEASLLQPEANAYRGVNSGYHKASWECVVGNYSEPAVAMNIPFPLDVPVTAQVLIT